MRVAGSGKTTIVTLRTLRLIEEGCKPEQILMITFTDKACGEMKSRLHRYACGSTLKDLNIETDKIVVRTFNSFGQELLDTHYAKLGFTEAPQLVDEILKKDIIVNLLVPTAHCPSTTATPSWTCPTPVAPLSRLGAHRFTEGQPCGNGRSGGEDGDHGHETAGQGTAGYL